MDYILRHKRSLKKCGMIEVIQSMFSDHNKLKLEINNGGNVGKLTNTGNYMTYS